MCDAVSTHTLLLGKQLNLVVTDGVKTLVLNVEKKIAGVGGWLPTLVVYVADQLAHLCLFMEWNMVKYLCNQLSVLDISIVFLN